MTIANYITDIVKEKSGNLPLECYSPYMINRWLSFINPLLCEGLNQLNSQQILEEKEMHYQMLLSFIPKLQSVPFINYVKKTRAEDDNKNENNQQQIRALSESLELSTREVSWLLRESSFD